MTARPAAGVILCGGASSRMGTAKALLPLDGTPLVAHLARAMAAAALDPVVAVTSALGPRAAELQPHVPRVLVDGAAPGASGPLHALVAAWDALGDDRALVCWPVDQPCVPPAVLADLAGGPGPFRHLPGDPLCAWVDGSLAAAARDLLRRGHTGVRRLARLATATLVPRTRLLALDPVGAWSWRCNTPEEFARLRARRQECAMRGGA
ncbi:MAG: NTP transferase domain-containing protein [Deltaproteobacteria bacterium]|nr:NTP transferase domain-containing protein [Deltaproteobacteria bacterium]